MLLALAIKLSDYGRDNIKRLCREPEWRHVMSLRGPADAIDLCRCRRCGGERVSIGSNPFVDCTALLCRSCGNVYMKSYHDGSPTPSCACGGTYDADHRCLRCRRDSLEITGGMSRLACFADHDDVWGPGP